MKIEMKKMMVLSKNTFLKTVVASMMSFGVIGFAGAQQADRPTNTSGWFKTCSETQDGEVCNVQYQVVSEDRRLVTALSLVELKGEKKRRVFRIIVPSGRSIPPGINLSVDNKQSTTVPYIFCRPQVCSAEVLLSDGLVKIFKGGGAVKVTSTDFQGNAQPVDITLKGFTAAFDGPPVKQPEQEIEKGQQTLKEQLENKIKDGASD